MRKLRIPWLASSKAAANLDEPLSAWLLEQERQVPQFVRQRQQDHLLRDVVQAWFVFVFVGSDSEVDSHYAYQAA